MVQAVEQGIFADRETNNLDPIKTGGLWVGGVMEP